MNIACYTGALNFPTLDCLALTLPADDDPHSIPTGSRYYRLLTAQCVSPFLRMEEALQHNETVDILKEDLQPVETLAAPKERPESEEVLKEAVTFSDISYSKNKLISFIQWVPEYVSEKSKLWVCINL